jgi:hypothetical protein
MINANKEPEVMRQQLRIDSAGITSYSQRMIAEFKTDLDFKQFPFDEQTFTIEIESYLYPVERVKLI